MAGKSSPGAEPAERALVIARVFDAPRNVVFQAWTKKEHLDRWCAPRGFTILDSGGELRPAAGDLDILSDYLAAFRVQSGDR